PKRTVIVSRESGYGIDLAKAYLQQARIDKRDATLVTVPDGVYDATTLATSLLTTTPDCLYLAGTSADFGALLSALHATPFRGTFVLSDGFYDPQTLKLYGAFLNDAWIATPMPPLDRISNASPDFFELRNALGATSALAVFSYAAAQIILAVAQRTGALSRLAVLQSMRVGGGYNTLIGPYSFDAFGNPINANVYFYKADGDKFAYRTAAIPSPYFF
ncbi:MAG: ABC transporter substrate-binding protein, partial [Vulcanimicrobiaceae bacterium]